MNAFSCFRNSSVRSWLCLGVAIALWMGIATVDTAHAKGSLAGKLRYGNFCGVDHGNSSPKKPIDQLDESCRRHDLCCVNSTKVGGVKFCPCHCDQNLVQGAKAFLATKAGRKSGKARRAALFIRTAYSIQACFCLGKVCKPKIHCEAKKKCKKILRKTRCIKVPKCHIKKTCSQGKTPGKGGKCINLKCAIKKACKLFLGKNFCFNLSSCGN